MILGQIGETIKRLVYLQQATPQIIDKMGQKNSLTM